MARAGASAATLSWSRAPSNAKLGLERPVAATASQGRRARPSPKSPHDQYKVVGTSPKRRDVAPKVFGRVGQYSADRAPAGHAARPGDPPARGGGQGGSGGRGLDRRRSPTRAWCARPTSSGSWRRANGTRCSAARALEGDLVGRAKPAVRRFRRTCSTTSAPTPVGEAPGGRTRGRLRRRLIANGGSQAGGGRIRVALSVARQPRPRLRGGRRAPRRGDPVESVAEDPPRPSRAWPRCSVSRWRRVRSIYVQGSGSYGRNDGADAGGDAALMSLLAGAPVRAQGMRADGHGWDPKGPRLGPHGAAPALSGRTARFWPSTDALQGLHPHRRVGLRGRWLRPSGRASRPDSPNIRAAGLPTRPGGRLRVPQLPHLSWESGAVDAARRALAPPAPRTCARPARHPDPLRRANPSSMNAPYAAGADPVAFRLAHIKDERHRRR